MEIMVLRVERMVLSDIRQWLYFSLDLRFYLGSITNKLSFNFIDTMR